MSEPKFITQLLSGALKDSTGLAKSVSRKTQIHIQGVFGGATVKIQGRLKDTLDFVQLHYEDGTLVEVTSEIADLLPQGLARGSEIRLIVVGGDGTTLIDAFLAEVE